MKITKSVWFWTVMCIPFIGAILASAYVLDQYGRRISTEFVAHFVKSEEVALLEGNFLSAMAKGHRSYLSSGMLLGSAVIEAQNDTKSVERLAVFGNFSDQATAFIPGSTSGDIGIQAIGLFHYVVSSPVPNDRRIILLFEIQPRFALQILGIQTALTFALLAALGVFTAAWMRLEGRRRVRIVSTALLDLAAERPLSATIFKDTPDFSVAWGGISAEVGRLRDEITRSRTYEAIANATQMLAHDVRRPFVMLKNAVALLSEAKTPEQVQSTTLTLKDEMDRTLKIVNDLVDDVMELGRKRVVELTEVDPLDVVYDAVVSIASTHNQVDVALNWSCGHTRKAVANSEKLYRVFINIIENAVQATHGKGQVSIRIVDSEPDKIDVCIGNDGPPIPGEDLPKLFEAFFTKGKANGTGLGLAIARKIVTDFGGDIRCHSAPEQGTNFVISLPGRGTSQQQTNHKLPLHFGRAAEGAQKASTLPEPHPTMARRPRIALVDDDIFVRESWLNALTGHAEIQTFAAPAAFRDHLQGDSGFLARLDLLITDLYFDNNDQENGVDFAQELSRNRPDLPILLASNSEVTSTDMSLFRAQIGKDVLHLSSLVRYFSGNS